MLCVHAWPSAEAAALLLLLPLAGTVKIEVLALFNVAPILEDISMQT